MSESEREWYFRNMYSRSAAAIHSANMGEVLPILFVLLISRKTITWFWNNRNRIALKLDFLFAIYKCFLVSVYRNGIQQVNAVIYETLTKASHGPQGLCIKYVNIYMPGLPVGADRPPANCTPLQNPCTSQTSLYIARRRGITFLNPCSYNYKIWN